RIMDSWRGISMHVCGIVGKRPCATSTHILEFRLGGVHARIGTVRRGLRITSISYSRQLGLQDCIANQWKMNDLSKRSQRLYASLMHIYEVRPRKDHRGVDLISDALQFGRLWYGEPNAVSNAFGYEQFYSPSHYAVIRVYDAADNVIQTREHKGDFKEP